jgi:Uma2 family endonuclease
MGVTTTALLTVEQFLDLPHEETERTELVEGEIVQMGNAVRLHELVKSNAHAILGRYIFENPIGKVFSETMYKLGPLDARTPDVSLLLKARLLPTDLDKLFEPAPELAVEVVSSETAAFLERTINLYLATGSQVVWVAYPQERTLWIHRASGQSLHLREGQYVEEPGLLPGFRVLVDQFFDGI